MLEHPGYSQEREITQKLLTFPPSFIPTTAVLSAGGGFTPAWPEKSPFAESLIFFTPTELTGCPTTNSNGCTQNKKLLLRDFTWGNVGKIKLAVYTIPLQCKPWIHVQLHVLCLPWSLKVDTLQKKETREITMYTGYRALVPQVYALWCICYLTSPSWLLTQGPDKFEGLHITKEVWLKTWSASVHIITYNQSFRCLESQISREYSVDCHLILPQPQICCLLAVELILSKPHLDSYNWRQSEPGQTDMSRSSRLSIMLSRWNGWQALYKSRRTIVDISHFHLSMQCVKHWLLSRLERCLTQVWSSVFCASLSCPIHTPILHTLISYLCWPRSLFQNCSMLTDSAVSIGKSLKPGRKYTSIGGRALQWMSYGR